MNIEALTIEYQKLLAWIFRHASDRSVDHAQLREALAARQMALRMLMRSEGNR